MCVFHIGVGIVTRAPNKHAIASRNDCTRRSRRITGEKPAIGYTLINNFLPSIKGLDKKITQMCFNAKIFI